MGGIVSAIRGPRVFVDVLSEHQLEQLREEFKRFDEDEKELLTFKQFERLLERRINKPRNKVEGEAQSQNPHGVQSHQSTSGWSSSTQETTPTRMPRTKSKQHIQDRTVAHQHAELAFQAADKNGDKVLTFEEFADWNRELIKSANAKRTPGWLDSDEV